MKTKYMKNNWMHFTLALGLMGAMATAAHAESFSAEVPFAFEAAGKSFPAGVYTVDSISGGVITIHNASSGESAAMMASPATLAEISQARYGLRKHRRGHAIGRESHERADAHNCACEAPHGLAGTTLEGSSGAFPPVTPKPLTLHTRPAFGGPAGAPSKAFGIL